MSVPSSGVVELSVGLAILLLTTVLGDRLVRAAGLRFDGRAARIAVGAGAGLAVVAHAFFACGLVGQFNGWAAAVIVAGVYLLARRSLVPFLSDFLALRSDGLTAADRMCAALRPLADPARGPEWALLVLLFAFAGIDLVYALAPEVGTDALVYHLPMAGRYLAGGRVAVDPEWMQTAFPQTVHMLFAVGLSWNMPVLAKLVHAGFGLLSAVCVWALAREIGGSRAGALWAAGAFVCLPLFTFEASTANVELAETLYVLVATLCLVRLAREPKQSRWLVAAGVFLGIAVGTKWNAAAFAVGGAVLVAAKTRSAARLALFVLAVAITSAPWWMRDALALGNPVYPFLTSLFGAPEGARPMIARWVSESLIDGYGMGRGPLDLLLLPVRMTFHYDRFGSVAIGGLWPALLPLLAVRWRSLKGCGAPLAMAAVGFAFFCATSHQARFLAPVLALLSVPVGIAIASIRRPAASLVVRVVALALLALNLPWLVDVIPYGHRRDVDWPADVIAGRATRADYVRRTWPDLAPAYASLDDLVDAGGRVVAFESPLRRFTERTVRAPFDSPSAFRLLALWSEARDPEALAALVDAGAVAIVADEYIDGLLFDVPFWDRVTLPVYRRRGQTVRRIYADRATYRYAPLRHEPPAADGSTTRVEFAPGVPTPALLSVVVLYDNSCMPDPGAVLSIASGTHSAERTVPHVGRYRLEVEPDDDATGFAVRGGCSENGRGFAPAVVSVERADAPDGAAAP